uniref:(northern house mosquito) hypothetical protein n=1 Tax=Culex pipiens TaxID=7175 RepID=A0A8D8D7M0_CULPI
MLSPSGSARLISSGSSSSSFPSKACPLPPSSIENSRSWCRIEAFSRARFFWNSSSTRRIASSSLNRMASLISASRDSFSATRRFSICRIVLWKVNRWFFRLEIFTGNFSISPPPPFSSGTGSCMFSLLSRRRSAPYPERD